MEDGIYELASTGPWEWLGALSCVPDLGFPPNIPEAALSALFNGVRQIALDAVPSGKKLVDADLVVAGAAKLVSHVNGDASGVALP